MIVKGSDKWGQGSGPRVEVVVGVLVAVSLIGVAFYYIESGGLTSEGQGAGATISTTGTRCNAASLPQAVLTVEQTANFTCLSNGRCYNLLGQTVLVGSDNLELTFIYYDGTVTYPCGTYPELVPQSEIQVEATPDGSVVSAKLVTPSGGGHPGSCDPTISVAVVSVNDVGSTIPAVPQLNVTLTVPLGGHPVARLQAVLTLDRGSQTFKFVGVTSTSPLTSARSVSSTEIVLSNLSFNSSEVYPMTISGTFDNGQAFTHQVHVQIAQAPGA
jgi:hypothetical protein